MKYKEDLEIVENLIMHYKYINTVNSREYMEMFQKTINRITIEKILKKSKDEGNSELEEYAKAILEKIM